MKSIFSGQQIFKMLIIGSITAFIVVTSFLSLPDRPDPYHAFITFLIYILAYFIAGVYCGKRLLGNSIYKSFWLVVPMPFVFMLFLIIKDPFWLTNISGIENLLMVVSAFGAFFYLIAFFVSFAGVSYGNYLSRKRNEYDVTPLFFKIAIIIIMILLIVVSVRFWLGIF